MSVVCGKEGGMSNGSGFFLRLVNVSFVDVCEIELLSRFEWHILIVCLDLSIVLLVMSNLAV
jgi:hypothetical protein